MREINYQTFYGCSSLSSIKIPDSVKSIGYSAFDSCTSLKKITLPDSVEVIEDNAFFDCSNLDTVEFGNNVKEIGHGSFSYCTKLSSVVFPASVRSIGDYAFYECINLKEIYFNGDAPVFEIAYDSQSANTFYNVTATVYCPSHNFTWAESLTNDYGGNITWVTDINEVGTFVEGGSPSGVEKTDYPYADGLKQFSAAQIADFKEMYQIPANVKITGISLSEPYFWEGAGMWEQTIEFYSGDQMIAGSDIDPDTYDMLGGIWLYTSDYVDESKLVYE